MSLLTQFYPTGDTSGSGGNGSTGTLSATYPPSFVYIGATQNVNPIGKIDTTTTAVWRNVYTYKDRPFYVDHIDDNNDRYDTLLINSLMVKSIKQGTNARKLTLNGALVDTYTNNNAQKLEAIDGVGIIHGISVTNGNLTNISPTISIGAPNAAGPYVSITNAKLNADSLNHILTSMVANSAHQSAFASISVVITGGTSAGTSALTAEGIAARDALVGGGWTVTLNP